MGRVFRSLLRFVAARPVRDAVRRLHRTWALRRAVRRLRSGSVREGELTRVIEAARYGWGNDGWAATLEYATSVFEEAIAHRGTVLECGSGLTTVLLGVAAELGGGRVVSLEHDAGWAESVRKVVAGFGLDRVLVVAASLRDFGPFDWYATDGLELPERFSLVICDGPPGDTRGGRVGLAHRMGARLAGATILVDDVTRTGEQEMLRDWERLLEFEAEVLPSNRPYARLSVTRVIRGGTQGGARP